MKLNQSISEQFFRKIDNLVFDMQQQKVGIKQPDGIATYVPTAEVSINPIIEFAISIPAFAVRTPVDNLKEGDILALSDGLAFFVSKERSTITTIDAAGNEKRKRPVKNVLLGGDSVLAVTNLFGNMEASAGGMNPMMMLALLGDDSEIDPLMLMFMSGGMGQTDNNNNPLGMLPLLMLLRDRKGSKGPFG